MASNASEGSKVGNVSLEGVPTFEIEGYSLVEGIGSEDNALFRIEEGELLLDQDLDQLTASVRLSAMLTDGTSIETPWLIEFLDISKFGQALAAAKGLDHATVPIMTSGSFDLVELDEGAELDYFETPAFDAEAGNDYLLGFEVEGPALVSVWIQFDEGVNGDTVDFEITEITQSGEENTYAAAPLSSTYGWQLHQYEVPRGLFEFVWTAVISDPAEGESASLAFDQLEITFLEEESEIEAFVVEHEASLPVGVEYSFDPIVYPESAGPFVWTRDGEVLVGQTDSTLALSDVDALDSGDYELQIGDEEVVWASLSLGVFDDSSDPVDAVELAIDGSITEGVLGSSDDVDLFSFELLEASFVSFQTTGGLGLSVTLFDGESQELDSGEVEQNEDLFEEDILLEAGSYSFEVTSTLFGRLGNYGISVEASIKANEMTWDQTFDELFIGDSSITLNAVSSADLGISYSSDDTSVVFVSGSELVIVGTGSTVIRATSSGDGFETTELTASVTVVERPEAIYAAEAFAALDSISSPSLKFITPEDGFLNPNLSGVGVSDDGQNIGVQILDDSGNFAYVVEASEADLWTQLNSGDNGRLRSFENNGAQILWTDASESSAAIWDESEDSVGVSVEGGNNTILYAADPSGKIGVGVYGILDDQELHQEPFYTDRVGNVSLLEVPSSPFDEPLLATINRASDVNDSGSIVGFLFIHGLVMR